MYSMLLILAVGKDEADPVAHEDLLYRAALIPEPPTVPPHDGGLDASLESTDGKFVVFESISIFPNMCSSLARYLP